MSQMVDAGRGVSLCASCSDISKQDPLITHVCKHRLCSVSWFSSAENNNGNAPEDIDHKFCG
eukprot:758776-Hanusia_phi.AAC.8